MSSRKERLAGIVAGMMDGVAERSLTELDEMRAQYKREGKPWIKTTKVEDDTQESLF